MRSPSPTYRRRFRSPSPPRGGFGPSRGGDRYRGGGDDDRDRRGGDRGGRPWRGGRERSRDRERDRDRDWDSYYRRRDGSPAVSTSASASGVGTQPASRAGSPEEGQITSPETRRRSRSPPPRQRSRSPRPRSRSPRRYNDRFSDRFRGGYGQDRDRDGDRRRGDWGRRRSSRSVSPRRGRGGSSVSKSPRSPRRDTRSPSPRRRSPEPSRPSISIANHPPLPSSGIIPPTLRAPPTGPRMERLPPTGPRAFGSGGRGPPGGYGTPVEPPTGPSAQRMPWALRAGPPPRGGVSPATSVGSSPYGASSPGGTLGAPTPISQAPTPSPLAVSAAQVPVAVPAAPAVPEDPETAARLREARILAELPQLKVPFLGAWEAELAAVQAHVAPLQQATLRAQASQRVAAAVLADAEAERLAAGERRRICEEHIMSGSLDAIIG